MQVRAFELVAEYGPKLSESERIVGRALEAGSVEVTPQGVDAGTWVMELRQSFNTLLLKHGEVVDRVLETDGEESGPPLALTDREVMVLESIDRLYERLAATVERVTPA